MDTLWALREQLYETEANFKLDDVWGWHAAHLEVPVFVCCVYLLVVFWLPGVLEARDLKFGLRVQMVVWNLGLAIFSTMGATRMVPHLLNGLSEKGFEGSICSDAAWFFNGPSGFWGMLFAYSKIPELVDTLFLVLKRRPVILLHWFHHCTVLLFCWHGYLTKAGPSLWLATMNYCVHAIMYTYYAAMAAKIGGKLLNTIAPFITSLQILQMLGGMIVVATAVRKMHHDGQCAADPANLKLGFAMYASYFVLFFMLFWNKYVSKPCKEAVREDPSSPSKMVCGVDVRRTDTTGCNFDSATDAKTGKTNGNAKDAKVKEEPSSPKMVCGVDVRRTDTTGCNSAADAKTAKSNGKAKEAKKSK